MRATRWVLFLLASLGAHAAHAAACPDPKTLDAIAKMGSVYIGEMHGTNETPAFVRCVVEHDIAKGMHPTVALEQLSPARDLHWPGWSQPDGRASKAMAGLIGWLDGQEKAGKLTIAWLLDRATNDLPASQDKRDQYMGEDLAPLVARGLVIAYTGSAHAQKSQHMGADVKPSGAYVADTMRHIMVAPAHDGTTWACLGPCGVHPLHGVASLEPGKLLAVDASRPDQWQGYDYIYAVPSFSASLPQLDASHIPAAAPATPHP
ncbi:hypothetical protein KPL74_15710 [Bacillus sp. NP157]|nr:hypothetical protein KPL74_15710 [Bacillus sp. NP157]